MKEIIDVEESILATNDQQAAKNRSLFNKKNLIALNLVSSPGSGKTTVLEATIKQLKEEIPLYVIEGDQQTSNDANRIKKAGAPALQINTGSGCHLDAFLVDEAIAELKPKNNAVVFIENVGNLVCPAAFDLGEAKRVVIISVTEGEDKPLKYPNMFESSDICIINKIDLLPYVQFNLDQVMENARRIQPNLSFFPLSATTNEGLAKWINWIKTQYQRL